jgi:hypothetical protein
MPFVQYAEVHILSGPVRLPDGLAGSVATNPCRLGHAKGLSQDDLAY